MKTVFLLFLSVAAIILFRSDLFAQCSVCTKTAQQLGDGPATGLNSGIMYLAFVPLLIVGYISFRWWQSEKEKHKN